MRERSCEAARCAGRAKAEQHTPVHVLPKYVFGRPVDQIESPAAARALPWKAKIPMLLLSAAFGWFCFYLALLVTGVPGWLPEQVLDLLLQVPGLHLA